MLPIIEPTTSITRSFSYKMGLAGFSSVDFFASRSAQCPVSQAEETSRMLYEFCYQQVSAEVHEYRQQMEALAQGVLHPEQAQQTTKPTENPFRVSQAPVTNGDQVVTTDPVTSTAPQVEKQEQAGKIQVGQDEDKGVTEKSTPVSTSEPASETKRGRGRPPKAANKPEDVPLALEHAAPNGPGQFKADDSDLPKNLGGTSELPPAPDSTASTTAAVQAGMAAQMKPNGPQLVPPSKPVLGQWERIQAVMDGLASQGKRTKDNVEAGVKTFCKSFLNRDKLPKPPDALYEPIVPIIERIAQTNPGVLLADPAKAGLEAGVGWNKFARHTEKWRDELKQAATAVVLIKYAENAMDLLDFLHNVAKLGELDKNLYVFLRTMAASNAAVAMTLRNTSEEKGTPMADMMAGIDWDHCTEGDILARISGVEKAVQPGQPAQTGELWPE